MGAASGQGVISQAASGAPAASGNPQYGFGATGYTPPASAGPRPPSMTSMLYGGQQAVSAPTTSMTPQSYTAANRPNYQQFGPNGQFYQPIYQPQYTNYRNPYVGMGGFGGVMGNLGGYGMMGGMGNQGYGYGQGGIFGGNYGGGYDRMPTQNYGRGMSYSTGPGMGGLGAFGGNFHPEALAFQQANPQPAQATPQMQELARQMSTGTYAGTGTMATPIEYAEGGITDLLAK